MEALSNFQSDSSRHELAHASQGLKQHHRASSQHAAPFSGEVIDTGFVYADNGLLDDKGLHRAVQSHQGHDSSPPGAQVLVHGQVVHLHQHRLLHRC